MHDLSNSKVCGTFNMCKFLLDHCHVQAKGLSSELYNINYMYTYYWIHPRFLQETSICTYLSNYMQINAHARTPK